MGRSVYFVRGAGIYPRLFSECQRGGAGCADGAKKEKDARTLKLVRGISLLSLGLTLLALVLNVLSAMGTVTMGNVLFAVLIVVSSPMVCSGYWALSLFLWACLLIVSHSLLRKNFN